MSDTLHLEGFAESLRGAKVYCVASGHGAQAVLKGRLDALDSDVSHRGRKVLVHQGSAVPKWLQRMGWDAMFLVRDVQDLKLALTFIQHMTKPGRVVWTGGDPAANVLALLAKVETLSLICVGERAPVVTDWQCIFWSPGTTVEDVEPAVLSRMGSQGRLRSILSELRASNVGLVWSSIGDGARGSLYWYDPSEGITAAPIDPEETAEILRSLADSMLASR
jgi:hypothetical protein